MLRSMSKEIIFYYDVICPYAYLASKLISDVAKRNGAVLKWRPVLLGGIYKSTKPEHVNIPDNKMILTYADQKRKVLARDLALQFIRYNVPNNRFSVPDIRTLNALRLIVSTENETSELRQKLTHNLFDAVWLHEKDVSNVDVLQDIADGVGYRVNVESLLEKKTVKDILLKNTDEAVERGAFGVPSFWVDNRLYFGGDRLFLVERALGNIAAQPYHLLSNKDVIQKRETKLTVYFDFSSPWSYLAIKQLPALLSSLTNVSVSVEWVPVLVGALFKTIGTPTVPMQSMSNNKRNFMHRDFADWLKYHQVNGFKFSSHFPMKTTMPLRIAIFQPEFKLIETIMDATWSADKDISNESILCDVLQKGGYDGKSLIDHSKEDKMKGLLRSCNERALAKGVCGVPSFQVDDGPVVFGQDRLNVVTDLLLGWQHPLLSHISKL